MAHKDLNGQMDDNKYGAYSEPQKEEEDIVKVTNAICNVLEWAEYNEENEKRDGIIKEEDLFINKIKTLVVDNINPLLKFAIEFHEINKTIKQSGIFIKKPKTNYEIGNQLERYLLQYLLFITREKGNEENEKAVKQPHELTTYIKELLDKKQFEISMENTILVYVTEYAPRKIRLPDAGKFYFEYGSLYFNIPCDLFGEPINLLGNLDKTTIEDIKKNIKNNEKYIYNTYRDEIKQNFLIELTKYVEEMFTIEKFKNFLKKQYPNFYDAHVNATTNQVKGGKRYHTKKRFSKKRSKSSKQRTHKRKKTRKSKR